MLFSILATDLGRPRSVHLNEAKTTAGEPRPGPAVVDDDAAARNSLKFSLELEGGRGGAGSLLRTRPAAKKSGDSSRLIRYNESKGFI